MSFDGPLLKAEQTWIERDEAYWFKAKQIVGGYPLLDLSDVYHTLRNLDRSPEERLRRGFTHAKLFGLALRQQR